jgi:hypothetical protein
MEEIEKDAMRFAKKLGHAVENLKTMCAPNTINPLQNIGLMSQS